MITSIITKAQINVTPEQLRTTNKIFVEHKHQKLIIKEQKKQLDLYDKKEQTYILKIDGLHQLISNKDSILLLTEQKHQVQETNLNNQIKNLKVQKRQLTFIAVLTTIVGVSVIFMK